jgi:hypothetical protein
MTQTCLGEILISAIGIQTDNQREKNVTMLMMNFKGLSLQQVSKFIKTNLWGLPFMSMLDIKVGALRLRITI